METSQFNPLTRKKSPNLIDLLPTSGNLLLHTLRAHLLWNAADNLGPTSSQSVDITQFEWEIKGVTPVPTVAQSDQHPHN